MPRVARLAHKCCVLRAVATSDNAHSSSGYWVLTGYPYRLSNTECNSPAPTDWPTIAAVVKRLRAGHGGLPQGIVLRVTASLGMASARTVDTIGSLFGRADKALYAAKEAGRNRYAIEPPP